MPAISPTAAAPTAASSGKETRPAKGTDAGKEARKEARKDAHSPCEISPATISLHALFLSRAGGGEIRRPQLRPQLRLIPVRAVGCRAPVGLCGAQRPTDCRAPAAVLTAGSPSPVGKRGNDSGHDSGNDSGHDSGNDSGHDSGNDSGNAGKPPANFPATNSNYAAKTAISLACQCTPIIPAPTISATNPATKSATPANFPAKTATIPATIAAISPATPETTWLMVGQARLTPAPPSAYNFELTIYILIVTYRIAFQDRGN